MKILLREFNNEQYVWKEATYDGRFNVNETPNALSNVVSVFDDNRNSLVKCAGCGKIFKKGSPEAEEHRRKVGTTEQCCECDKLYPRTVKKLSRVFESNEDGTYNASIKEIVELRCSNMWRNPLIESETAKSSCRYRACANEMIPVTDIFIEYPGAFDDIITVDKIIESGYKERFQVGSHTRYLLRSNNRIYAGVNKLGIVDHFIVKYYSNSYTLFYSKKYDTLFSCPLGTYTKWNPGLLNETVTRIKNKIASLYN